ncbi:FecR domain-containing protein [Rhabdobacter roseus]|uniref:Ferric-dicitrate binding protein FerR (Iron transport regulator) n=1 Tax=Rhabdobacter roseus TaxID=1655419 RepID=A0A840TM21_9BACT|nr:FecR domain-containing protein [Rhabdobacter roseus]MBB5285286.1 ferric-dicitrate binding protein FerR (iron transport regulator) [Rhabdobacter roseus]
MKQAPLSPELLQKYLLDECTAEERDLVEAWYASLQGTSNYLSTLSEAERNRLQQETFRHIQHQLATSRPQVPVLTLLRRPWLGVAAALVLVAGLLWLWPTRQSTPTEARVEGTAPALADGQVHFVNDQPRPVMHQLPDGSTLWLHTGASITYPSTFAASQRQVSFEGEGFFDITPDKKRPFVIRSGEMTIEVLGTRFNVKAPPAQRIFEVAVVSGSVAVSAADHQANPQKVVLAPHQQVLFETSTKRLTQSTLPVQDKKEIYEPVTVTFEGTPLDRALEQLDKRFDVRLHLANPAMKTCQLTADFEQQPLPAILEMLCASLDATYTMSGKTILIEGAGCD